MRLREAVKQTVMFGVLLLALFWTSSCLERPANQSKPFDLLLVGGAVVDGSGAPPRLADVAVAGERIVGVGPSIDPSLAVRRLDVSGRIVAPGFWDNHAHLVTLEERPEAENFVRQGITTVIASLHSQDQVFPLEPYRERVRPGVNVGLFAGHTWIRKQVMGTDNRVPTEEELAEMVELVDQSMRQGALGLSTGLEYVPAVYAKPGEVTALAQVAANYGGLYVTHLRDEGPRVLEAIEETLEVARRTGIPVQINHHKITGADQFGWSEQTLAKIDEAVAEGLQVAHDVYPYTAYSTYSDLMFPPWALAEQAFAQRAADPATLRRLKREMIVRFRQQTGLGPDSIQFRAMKNYPELQGKTLGDYLVQRGRPETLEEAVDALIELQLEGGFIGIFYGMSDEDLVRILRHPTSMFETDGDLVVPGEGHPHPRSYGSFPRVLGYHVRERGDLTLEEAIRKMTSMPASWFGDKERGLVAPGLIADLVVFDPDTVEDKATYSEPHQYPVGIEHVLVSGRFVVENEKGTGELPGLFLTRPE